MKSNRSLVAIRASFSILLVTATAMATVAEPLTLARDGVTDYAIVTAADASPVDRYAASELALYLGQMTGADFAVIDATALAADAPAIFVGLSAPALERLDEADPLADFADQEHVWQSRGRDVFLYGEGIHGNLNAVMAFLEDRLDWRWYSVFERPVLPEAPTLGLTPFDRRHTFSFGFRAVDLQRGLDYFYQQGSNQRVDKRVASIVRRSDDPDVTAARLKPFVSRLPEVEGGTHSLFSYIPPDSGARGAHRFDWLEKRDYFDTHPEFFSLWDHGQRVKNRQLCFANPDLRRELTGNILRHIAEVGEPVLLDVGAEDSPGRFCYCDACQAMTERYQSPGGPLYDYLFELCERLESRHPGVRIKTLAYRRAQTQKPPALPPGEMLPSNLIIDFAPIEDNYFADWTHPDARIQETYADLQAWNRITHPGNLWAWLYPNPWGSGIQMPVGNVERLVINMRKMHAAGVRGVYTDHCSYHWRGGWSELQAYLFYKLCRDIDVDTETLIDEFTAFMYGPAAPLIRAYLAELEAERKAMTDLPPGVTYRSALTDARTFPYLTPENIHRWQGFFEHMESILTDADGRERANVRFVRRELDLATLWKWFDLQASFPDHYRDHQPVVDRIAEVNAIPALPAPEWEDKRMNRRPNPGPGPGDFATLIEAGGEVKPLPAAFDGIDPERIRQFAPSYPNTRSGRAAILDTEAAFGYGVPVAMPDLPFVFGFHQGDRATRDADALPALPADSKASWERAMNLTFALQRALPPDAIDAGRYSLYRLAEVEITPNCIVWFSNRSWGTKVELGERLYEPGGENRWDAWVSLKFVGPTYGDVMGEALLPPEQRAAYGGLDPRDLVLVDRVILVNLSADQFADP